MKDYFTNGDITKEMCRCHLIPLQTVPNCQSVIWVHSHSLKYCRIMLQLCSADFLTSDYELFSVYSGIVIVSAFTVTSCFILCVNCCICIWYLIHNVITVPPVATVICKPPSDCKWPTGRPYHTWLRDQWIWFETAGHWSFLRVEDGNISRTLAFNCRHGYAQENRDTAPPHFLSQKTLQPTTLLYSDHAGDEKFSGCGPSHLDQFTSHSANCNSPPSDIRSTSEGPRLADRQRVWGLFMTCSTNPLIIIIIVYNMW